LRYNLRNSIFVIESCTILHNLSVMWNDVMPRYLYEDGEPDIVQQPPGGENIVIDYNNLPR
jgi:hypothetical protein